MAIRVYRVAVVGCPKAVVTEDASFDGVGKSCLCNRFVRTEAYSEAHRSLLSEADWSEPVYNRDHFVYWGAATKHLQDGSKVRFQIVEQTEFYDNGTTEKLCAHQAKESYLSRASALRFSSQSGGKVAYKMQPVLGGRNGRLIRATQLFPSEDFSSKSAHGVYGFVCVFDPSLEGEEMRRQLDYLSELLHELGKRKRKVILACTKCDAVDETKIRHGSNLANYALKKPIPFIEVSAREGINVEDAFFTIISSPKKRKATKSGKRSATGYLTYREAVSLRKGDLNRARDAYRRLLQRKVTDFSCVWIEVFPVLEREQEFSLVLQLGGKEGKDIVKKMFCLRLIEIKLMEASKRFGFSSARKKLDQSRSYQVYLSEAFKGHPDLGTESLYDYVYSPGASISGEVFGSRVANDTSSDYTEPSTPNTYSSSRNTPECISPSPYSVPPSARYSLLPPPRPRSATLCHTIIHLPDDGSSSYDTSTLPISAGKKTASADQLLASPQRYGFHGDDPPPPPLPYRAETSPLGEALRKNDDSTKSQDVFSLREGAIHRLSNSMDPLLVPEDDRTGAVGSSVDLNAEPYLQPIEVKHVMATLPLIPAVPLAPLEKRDPNSFPFRSVRLPKQSERAPIPYPDSTDLDRSLVSRTGSLKARGHRRSQSNPWVLESSINMAPPPIPPIPPRTSDIPPPVPPRDTPKHRSKTPPPAVYTEVRRGEIVSPIESSLDFPDSALWRGLPQTPHIPFTPQTRVSGGLDSEDDNISNVSGPFEEIDEPSRNADDEANRIGSPSEVSIVSKSQNSALSVSISDDKGDDLGQNQYAKIDEFQQYLQMAPASAATLSAANRGATFPPPAHSPPRDDTDNPDFLRERSATMHPYNHRASAPVIPLERDRAKKLIRKWKKSTSWKSVDESSAFTQQTAARRSQLPDPHRPLPPSPTKLLKRTPTDGLSRTISSGSNIYEVIDEDYLSKVRNGKQMLAEDGVIPEFTPPVHPEDFEKYLEVVQRFFNIPEVRDYWISSVQAVMPEADPSDFPPPFYSPPLGEFQTEAELQQETETESQETETEPQLTAPEAEEELPAVVSKVRAAVNKFESATGRPPSQAEKSKKQLDDRTKTPQSSSPLTEKQVDDETPASESPPQETPKMKRENDVAPLSKSLPRSSEKPKKQADERTSSSHSLQPASDRATALLRTPITHASSTPTSPTTHRLLHNLTASKPTPPIMTRSSSGTPRVFKKAGSRDNMIEFLNRTLNQAESSDSESGDDSGSDTESEMDLSDRPTDPGKVEPSQPNIQLLLSFNGDIESTDLDDAVMRPSVSTDSDFASDAVKSPQSNSTEEVNQITSSSSAVGSTLVPRRSSPRRKGDPGETKNLRDSGINISNCHSQTFDDTFNEQNFESDC